jgi:uncharacterized protein (TIGR02300 family)
MSTKADRGTKRTCQNPECGSRFYDLNRNPVVCPICESAYQLEPSAAVIAAAAAAAAEKAAARKTPKTPVFEPVVAKADPVEGEDDLVVIESEDDDAGGDDDETFLEAEEEDGSDMSNIIGGPVAEPEEPQ